jgi:uncharacterized membrane protein (UPF0127 family)
LTKLRVTNVTRGTLLAERADVADTAFKTRAGLRRHAALGPSEGLWIAVCEAVHTFGMRFPIDVAFLDRKKRVVKTRSNVLRGRIAFSLRAHSVLELPAGTLDQTGTQAGDQLAFEKYSSVGITGANL